MASAGGSLTRRMLEEHLAARAAEDESFRLELLANPRGVLERELQFLVGGGVRLPDGLHVRIHEERADTFELVLPSRRYADAADRETLTFLWQGALNPRE
jgi:hypothetical protein